MFKLLSISLFSLLFLSACNQPKETAKTSLDHDIQELMALNTSYQHKDIDAMTYLKKSRIIKEKIKHDEETLSGGHTHTH